MYTCVYFYIHNTYTQYTHILHKQKLLFWNAINRLRALIQMFLNTLLSHNAGEEGARRREVFQNIIYFNNPINKESDKEDI